MDIKVNASNQDVSSINSNISIKQFLKFFIPSILGLIVFILPIPYVDGKFVSYAEGFTIPISVIKDCIQGYIGTILPSLVVISNWGIINR